ncbi:PLD nuclease N-terminal domain-containing protein [Alkalibacterium olivapovliticus]|uniref:Phospholipase D-like protein n=1 Tax=Alkalibacterium olivapovliticus TaxID=99907 RepID=A0A2T0WAA6_9LACT|nr:PLD nuclease N-terminal domain-containing protein [Alkalibacterium olivapovliticus]PRY83632.1 phospholipase D-like protein [Alkalibacterium olivapovliticus]
MSLNFMEYLPIIIPLLILQLILLVTAILHLIKNDQIEKNDKIIWALVIVFINIIGPIIYLIFGRKED